MNRKTLIAIAIVSMMLIPALSLTAGSYSADSDSKILFDMGNGEVYWSDVDDETGTMGSISSKAATSLGITFSDAGVITINGKSTATVETGSNFKFYQWAQYVWNDVSSTWEPNDTSLDQLSTSGVDFVLFSYYNSFDNGSVSEPLPTGDPSTQTPMTNGVQLFVQYNGLGSDPDEWFACPGTASVYAAIREMAMNEGLNMTTYRDVNNHIAIKSLNGLADNVSWSRYVPTGTVTDGNNIGDDCDEKPILSVDITTDWKFYVWSGSKWVETVYQENDAYSGEIIAWGFYPAGGFPTATPGNMYPWTMIRGDSASSGSTTSDAESQHATTKWFKTYETGNYVCSTIMSVGNYVFVLTGGDHSSTGPTPVMYCYDRFTGAEKWSFAYPKNIGYEVASPLVVGDSIYIPASNRALYKVNIESGDLEACVIMPTVLNALGNGQRPTGAASLIYDSGVIYFGSSNGMIYCCNTDLEVIWQFETTGWMYYNAPIINDGVLFMGAYDGILYALDQMTGNLIDQEQVYERAPGEGGLADSVVFVDGMLVAPYSDGMGMDTKVGGVKGYEFTKTGGFVEKWNRNDFGLVSNYSLPVGDSVYISTGTGLQKIKASDGTSKLLNGSLGTVKAPLTLVNDKVIYAVQYDRGGSIYALDLDGKILSSKPIEPQKAYGMSPAVIIGDWVYFGNDYGAMFGMQGVVTGDIAPDSESSGEWYLWIIILVIILLILALMFYLMKIKGIKLFGESKLSYTQRNKRRLLYVVIAGSLLALFLVVLSLSIGQFDMYSLSETLGILMSSIAKGGSALNADETIIFGTRLPRVLMAFAVGIGLSVAGAMYQAIIRNPLVDPYIMGVSSGAGAIVIAVIAFNFSLFGLLSTGSLYITAVAAIIGGLVAFFATMFIAERAGKSSVNYVLAGVVVGLAFGAVQTILLSMSGDKIHDAMTWLFGTFANTSWSEVWMVLIPVASLAVIPLIWAKEFNLVLLGEDQAKQMGLDVVKFNRMMLILASVITAICVAFVGVIGFVGLVVPHLCRMILGGDHRLVFPASIVLGGCLMMIADLLARTILMPQDLPVGAITIMIGVPIFAYLLIKRGRMYDG